MERKPPRRTRERILGVSLGLFNDYGEANVTTAAIAEELNISPGNLYYHFRNKEDIVNALFEDYERDMEPLLQVRDGAAMDAEAGWLFLHLLFEAIWKHRFIYRDITDLTSGNRKIETRFKSILQRKNQAIQGMCHGLSAAGQMHIDEDDITHLATNIVVIATWWLSYEYATNARRFNDPAFQSEALARAAFQVAALTSTYLTGTARLLFEDLAKQYLHR
jgi:AcrR family transcriptional regulator